MALFAFERYFGSSEASYPFDVFYVCPKVVFLDKYEIAFFPFKICTDEYILGSFGLCVPKLYFHFNLKWYCLRLKDISDPLKPPHLFCPFFIWLEFINLVILN